MAARTFLMKFAKTGKAANLRRSKCWVILARREVLEHWEPCRIGWLCYNFARTICHYVFESVTWLVAHAHSGEGNVCSSRGDSIFSVLPTFKAAAKPKKCHLFSEPCSGTENSKSSALVIRLRVRPRFCPFPWQFIKSRRRLKRRLAIASSLVVWMFRPALHVVTENPAPP